MATKYVLQQKVNPQQKDAPRKWYAVPVSEAPMDEDAATRTASEDTTFNDIELGAAAKLIARFVLKQLSNGQRATIPGLGTFRITFGSEGVDSIDDFNTSMIRNPRITYLANAKLRNDLLKDLSFTNAGIREDNIYYATLANYREVKGLTGGGTTNPGGGTGGGEGEDPLG